jgi:hypothetical protein
VIRLTIPGAPQGKGRVPVERLVELFSYEPESGALCWRVDRGQRARKGEAAGSVSQQGYRVVGFDGLRNVFAHRIAWAMQTGAWPDKEIDHIDGDRTNNAWANLRLATTAQNHQNMRRARSDNKAGLLGVSPRGSRFRAQIQVGGKKRWLGEFDTPEEAANAYIAAKRQLHTHGTL